MSEIKNVLRNFAGFVDGRGYAGQFASVTLPKLTIATRDYRAGGMDGATRIDIGLEPMEAMLESNGLDVDLLRTWGVGSEEVPWTFRGSVQDGVHGEVRPVVAEMRGWCSEEDFGDWKAGEEAPVKLKLEVQFYKLTVDGDVVHEIDVENMVRIVNGTDQLEGQRQALGI
ncbi:MAG: phage major tail tube protein [Acidobacteria bacterium]|nr:phage major tail tube protein [Acidobacteriota bacterium]